MTKTNKCSTLLIYAAIILFAVLHAMNFHLFIVENNFAPAGINGVATMIQYKTGFSIAYMSLLINIPLCTAAYFLINKSFALRSMCFCLVYSFTYLFLQKLGLSELQYDAGGVDTIFPVILSGVLSGLVYGLCFRFSASTGGTDIISKFISMKRPTLNFFWVTFALNSLVAAASFFVYAETAADGTAVFDYRPVCLCVTYCFVSSFVGSYIIKGTKNAYKFTVITSHAEDITKDILVTLKHGVTKLEGIGSYSHIHKDILICVVNRHQLVDFQNILKKYDDTFAFSETVNETYGNFAHVK